MDALKNYMISFIRTAVPFVVSFIVGWLATRHISLDNESIRLLTLGVEGLAGIMYWQVARVLEHIDHRFGWLLGYAKMPSYIVLPDGKVPGVGDGPEILPPSVPTMYVPGGTGVASK